MKTLIIHPDDRSTDFLKAIYQDIEYEHVVSFHINRSDLHTMIKAHDQIIMLGHGSPSGLFNIAGGGYLIGSHEVEVLRGKELIAIWCHADKFMEHHQLNGLFSGMFVSEVSEAMVCGLGTVSRDLVAESNNEFARVLGEGLIKYPDDKSAVWSIVLDQYSKLAGKNSVAEYNVSRWYYKE